MHFWEWVFGFTLVDWMAIMVVWFAVGYFGNRPYDPKASFWENLRQGIIFPFGKLKG